MALLDDIFDRINNLTHEDGHKAYSSVLLNSLNDTDTFEQLKIFYCKILKEIDDLSAKIKKDDKILISVKNQRLLKTCFQLIASLNIFPCLLPGLGVHISQRCVTGDKLPKLNLSDEQKYEMLVDCADFFIRCYEVPVLKNIIITQHLADYLAMLIQLSFAPLKKPGTYPNYTMTLERYDTLMKDRQKYLQIYKHLVTSCFQPFIMKELLVLHFVTNPAPPQFVIRLLGKELSQRLLAPGGLLSLIRCFMETYNINTGYEWRKMDSISKIVSIKQGTGTEDEYLQNICSQIKQILTLNNTPYLATVVTCALKLQEKYSNNDCVDLLIKEIFHSFHVKYLNEKADLPGTIILSPQEVEQKVHILYAGVCTTKLDCPFSLLSQNLYVLFLLGIKCAKNDELKIKLKDIILKCLEQGNKSEVHLLLSKFLFGPGAASKFDIEEYDAGVAIKCKISTDYPKEEALLYFLNIFKAATDNKLIECVFEVSLQMLIDLNEKRLHKPNKDLLGLEDDQQILDSIDEEYVIILQLLSELSTSPKIISSLKTNPAIVLHFIEHFLKKSHKNSNNEECTTIGLVLLNTILANSVKTKLREFEKQLCDLMPILKRMSEDESGYNNILCQEALSLLTNTERKKSETEFEKAVTDTFDELMPVQAHGIIALTKLVDAKDPETISKKHYVFCLFQEHLKNQDSYMYLSAINGIAALGSHCTEDVLSVLCQEFLQMSNEDGLQTKEGENGLAELRMKIGDIVVKVTKRLGEMAIVHKTILLNTMLCGCRDDDPLIRTSALSNVAEIARVLHYKIGTIIYEVLHCIWSILETDKAIECRRAAVMVISSLITGSGKDVLVELKDVLLPVYRTLKNLYRDPDEDSTLRLHAQIALEELNQIVNEFMFPDLKMEKQIFVLDKPQSILK